MTAPDEPARPATPTHPTTALLERLTAELGNRASTVVYGEPFTTAGVTVIPVVEVGLGFGGSADPEAAADESPACGGVRARPRGFIEIKDGTATYKPLRNPWLDVAVPLAAVLVGAALPPLARRLAARRARTG
ncbi:GerW family sporulation protein [Streptomyces sp. NPDC058961]|uniref:GerW family sporulation protein n=1 Tax=unclassified Streptomyces TaxID=2593676 RepID=UPI000C26FBDF|nr:spore germination protein GerW family protein [Streptomyces sp. CB01201]PJN03936.1 sporulation protein [Streptomyces sp. CB01201]